MPFTPVTSVNGTNSDSSNATTGAITTSGIKVAIAVASHANAGSIVVSDNKSNVWSLIINKNASNVQVDIWAALLINTGASHTFLASGASKFPSICVDILDGGDFLSDQTNSNNGASVGTLSTGSITPALDAELLVAGYCGNNSVTANSVDSGFTLATSNPADANNLCCALARLIQTTAAAKNPTLTFGGTASLASSVIASFRLVVSAGILSTSRASILG